MNTDLNTHHVWFEKFFTPKSLPLWPQSKNTSTQAGEIQLPTFKAFEIQKTRNYKCLVIYFALSAEATLMLDPFQRPLETLQELSPATISTDLPFHKFGQNELYTVAKWAKKQEEEPSFFPQYLDQLSADIKTIHSKISALQSTKLPLPVALIGLSRGTWIAMNVLSRLSKDPYFQTLACHLLLYAPMTQIKDISDTSILNCEFQMTFDSWMSIGNHDTKVSTEQAFLVHQHLLKSHITAQKASKTTSMDQLIKDKYPHHFCSYPSHGYMGHGTSEAIFDRGAQWLSQSIASAHTTSESLQGGSSTSHRPEKKLY